MSFVDNQDCQTPKVLWQSLSAFLSCTYFEFPDVICVHMHVCVHAHVYVNVHAYMCVYVCVRDGTILNSIVKGQYSTGQYYYRQNIVLNDNIG